MAARREVFLGGSRLKRFMETVEKTTAAITEPAVVQRTEGKTAGADVEERMEPPVAAVRAPAVVSLSADPWAGLLQTGLNLFEQLAVASRTPPDARPEGLSFVQRDPQTGQDYLRIPVPSADVLDRALQAIGAVLDRFRK